jgi:hypothetical protein
VYSIQFPRQVEVDIHAAPEKNESMRCGRSVVDPPDDPVVVQASREVAERMVELHADLRPVIRFLWVGLVIQPQSSESGGMPPNCLGSGARSSSLGKRSPLLHELTRRHFESPRDTLEIRRRASAMDSAMHPAETPDFPDKSVADSNLPLRPLH